MPETTIVQPRIVPGAPPPAPLSKTQKKKLRAKARATGENSADNNIDHVDTPTTPTPEPIAVVASIEKPSDTADEQKGSLAPEPVAPPEPETPSIPEELKPSPIVELVNKRLKAMSKKITRITAYAATDPEKLNDDQMRTLKTLPTLEAIQKELGEVKKAVEIFEAGLVHELVAKKLEAEKVQRVKIAEAVAASQDLSVNNAADIIDLLRLRSLLAAGELDTLAIDHNENSALLAAADALLGNDEEKREAVIRGFLLGAGEFDGLSYTHLVEITKAGLALPRIPTPPPVEPVEQELESVTTPVVAATSVSGAASISKGSFSFVQESEIDGAQAADDGEWVDAGAVTQEYIPQEELVNGDIEQEVSAAPEAPEAGAGAAVIEESAPLDWTTEETDLPPIATVQESIGASGSVTPGDAQPDVVGETSGDAADSPTDRRKYDEGGFKHARGRGRGRSLRGGYRSFRGERGAFRGGDRGSFRGGERGGFHGSERGGERSGPHGGERGGERSGPHGGFPGGERSGFRGGERSGGFPGGENSEFRGGDRGGFRGRGEGRGGYRSRGEWRGDGEHRGRGRGRGRGGDRGGAPATSGQTPAEPAT